MSGSNSLILRLVAASVGVADRAGVIVRDIMKKGELGIVEKGLNDLQTEADRSTQRFIVSSLKRQFPHVTFIGEEGELDGQDASDTEIPPSDADILSRQCPPLIADVKDEQVTVWVDPLDGTAEYTQGLLDHVTVLIGIAVGDKAVAGVIHQPYFNYKNKDATLGRTIWGIPNVGTGGFSPKTPPEGKRILTTTRSHPTPEVQEALDVMAPDEVLRVGGAGHKVLLLLEGKAHAYVFASPGCKKWDTCAPEAVLVAAGGRLTDMLGRYYPYDRKASFPNRGGVLATAKVDEHSWYLERVPAALRAKLEK